MNDNEFGILQPKKWPAPKGYANGIVAEGRQVFIAGQIGWAIQAIDRERIHGARLISG